MTRPTPLGLWTYMVVALLHQLLHSDTVDDSANPGEPVDMVNLTIIARISYKMFIWYPLYIVFI